MLRDSGYLPITSIQVICGIGMIEQDASNKSIIILKNIFQNTQTVQLFVINFKTEMTKHGLDWKIFYNRNQN